jgi:hypothetical protein
MFAVNRAACWEKLAGFGESGGEVSVGSKALWPSWDVTSRDVATRPDAMRPHHQTTPAFIFVTSSIDLCNVVSRLRPITWVCKNLTNLFLLLCR